MNTIIIISEALAKASNLYVDRLDIRHDKKTDSYTGLLFIGDEDGKLFLKYMIFEDGTVTKM